MLAELLSDLLKLALAVAGFWLIVSTFLRSSHGSFAGAVARWRVAALAVLVLVLCAVEISEDMLDGDSSGIDEWALRAIRAHVPQRLGGFFEAVTLSGSAWMLTPLAAAASAGMLLARHRFEAALLAGSTLLGAFTILGIKTFVGRDRPQLWEAPTYWGSSFPSGHTLAVAAFATAAVLCVARLQPAARGIAVLLAMLWIALVALSRLVIGVHWPTDVLAAACIGAALPLVLGFLMEVRSASRTPAPHPR